MTQQQQQTEQQPPTENERIRERKKQVIGILSNKFNEDIWRERLLKMCGGDESRIMKALNSFITYIMNDDGGKEKNGQKKYIADCSVSSISTAFLEAFQMGIEVGGGRDHAYLVNYDGQCELDISYKGFVYALNKHFANAYVIAECVFEGDSFDSTSTDMTATYTHKPNPKFPFGQGWAQLTGAYCFFSYTTRESGEKVSRLVRIQRGANTGDKTPDSLEMIRSKAKGSFAWVDFPFEQCKKAVLRRAAKVPFASIDFGDDDTNPEAVDNKHFQLEGSRDGGGDRLKLLMDKQQELMEDEAKPTAKEPEPTPAPAPAPVEPPVTVTGAPPIIDQPPDSVGQLPPDSVGQLPPEPQKKEISDADFEDEPPNRPAPPVSAYDNHIGGDTKMIEQPPPPSPMHDASAYERAPVWDGRTLMMEGKITEKDFPTAGAACIYLKKVISQRKHKKSRLGLIAENPSLMAALIKEGQGGMIADLHKIASEGL